MLISIRGLLRHGAEHLTERQHARLRAALVAGDPTCEVEIAWHCYPDRAPSGPRIPSRLSGRR